jgi:hypothetical protein
MSILASKTFRSPPPPNISDLRILTILDIGIRWKSRYVDAIQKAFLQDSHIMNNIVLYNETLYMLYINMYLKNMMKNSNAVEKSCDLIYWIIYTIYMKYVKYIPYRWGDPADPSYLTVPPTSRPPKFFDLPNFTNFLECLTSKVCRLTWPLKIFDLPNLP